MALPVELQLSIFRQTLMPLRGYFSKDDIEAMPVALLKLVIDKLHISNIHRGTSITWPAFSPFHDTFKTDDKQMVAHLGSTQEVYIPKHIQTNSFFSELSDIPLEIYIDNADFIQYPQEKLAQKYANSIEAISLLEVDNTQISQQLNECHEKISKWTCRLGTLGNVEYALNFPNVKVIELSDFFHVSKLCDILSHWKSTGKMNNVELIFPDNLDLAANDALEKVKPDSMTLTPRVTCYWSIPLEERYHSAAKYIYELNIFTPELSNLNLSMMVNVRRLIINAMNIEKFHVGCITKNFLEPLKQLKHLEYLQFTTNSDNISHSWNLSDYLPKSLKFLKYEGISKEIETFTMSPNLEEAVFYDHHYKLDVTLNQAKLVTHESIIEILHPKNNFEDDVEVEKITRQLGAL